MWANTRWQTVPTLQTFTSIAFPENMRGALHRIVLIVLQATMRQRLAQALALRVALANTRLCEVRMQKVHV